MTELKWQYRIAVVGWSDFSREQKKEISSKIVDTGYVYKRYKTSDLAVKDANYVEKLTGIKMNVQECYPALGAPF
jgi:hypothetical protein